MAKKTPTKIIQPVEVVSIESINPHPKNYKTHPEDQLTHIVESIRRNGVYRNIIISKDNVILGGHGVVEALKRIGALEVPVVRLPIQSGSPAALKIVVGDNEVQHLAEMDERALSELLKTIKDEDVDGLLGTGYDEMMLANLLFVSRPASEIADIDEAADWVGMPEFETKDTPLQIIMSFKTKEDRLSFLEKVGCTKFTNKTRSLWWPLRDREDTSSVNIEG